MQQLSDFLQMGGYGTFVWSAYGICLVVLLINLIRPLKTEKKILRNVQTRLERMKQEP